MRVHVSDPTTVPELCRFLKRNGAIVRASTGHEVDVGLLGSYGSQTGMRMDLYLLLRDWEDGPAKHREADIVG